MSNNFDKRNRSKTSTRASSKQLTTALRTAALVITSAALVSGCEMNSNDMAMGAEAFEQSTFNRDREAEGIDNNGGLPGSIAQNSTSTPSASPASSAASGSSGAETGGNNSGNSGTEENNSGNSGAETGGESGGIIDNETGEQIGF